ncbi:hypothetical protein [Collinsella sp. An2]|uniref:hypothetical protein n=1 Tax=Collinsella sp. An2 TaxID=1965585 RepID=UPI000B370851|nr:hypothetical protein [Collinsella sp. An2]OUP08696.1 hypothetical protein B5F33_06685 [Collinsella sp. An2]
MKKTSFIVNFIVWAAIVFGTTAFLAWYHLTDADQVATLVASSPVAQAGTVLAAPLLLYAMGVVLGLLLVFFKKIEIGRTSRLVLRVLAILALVLFVLAAIPSFAPSMTSVFELPIVVVVYVSMAAPILIMMFGLFYALGIAPVDSSRRGPFAKYLPDDHFE